MAWMEQREQEIKTIRMDWSDHGGENVLSTDIIYSVLNIIF